MHVFYMCVCVYTNLSTYNFDMHADTSVYTLAHAGYQNIFPKIKQHPEREGERCLKKLL